jgi:hypothetical protein
MLNRYLMLFLLLTLLAINLALLLLVYALNFY